jgi:proline racemase
MDGATRVTTVDYHTAGEPFRIVLDGVPDIEGSTVLARRETASHDPAIDRVRELLVREPRGHADMYGCFLVPPDDDGADLGVLFWHKDGYSTACGHGTIALGAWAVRSGRVPSEPNGTTDVVIDVPSGRVTARVTTVDGVVTRVGFRNVGARVIGRDIQVETSRGPLTVDISDGGAIYASLPAASASLAVTPEHHDDLVALGRQIKWALNDTPWAAHRDPRLSGIYGTIWYDDLGTGPGGALHQRNVTVFADGEVDRSPCGSGTSARLALLVDEGRIGAEQTMLHDSIIGSRFEGRVLRVRDDVVMTEIEGQAFETARSTFVLDPDDPLGTGFLLR